MLDEALRGLAGAHSELRVDHQHRVVFRGDAPVRGTVGLVSGVLQPIAARQNLRNLPEEAIFNWEPYGQFGIYLPDTFWYGG